MKPLAELDPSTLDAVLERHIERYLTFLEPQARDAYFAAVVARAELSASLFLREAERLPAVYVELEGRAGEGEDVRGAARDLEGLFRSLEQGLDALLEACRTTNLLRFAKAIDVERLRNARVALGNARGLVQGLAAGTSAADLEHARKAEGDLRAAWGA